MLEKLTNLRNLSKAKKKNGFMMVELMIAVVVIGFLLAMFIARTNEVKEQVKALESNLTATQTRLQEEIDEELRAWKDLN